MVTPVRMEMMLKEKAKLVKKLTEGRQEKTTESGKEDRIINEKGRLQQRNNVTRCQGLSYDTHNPGHATDARMSRDDTQLYPAEHATLKFSTHGDAVCDAVRRSA